MKTILTKMPMTANDRSWKIYLMYIDFVDFFEKNSKKFVDRNGNVVPLLMWYNHTPKEKIASIKEKNCNP